MPWEPDDEDEISYEIFSKTVKPMMGRVYAEDALTQGVTEKEAKIIGRQRLQDLMDKEYDWFDDKDFHLSRKKSVKERFDELWQYMVEDLDKLIMHLGS